MYGEVVLPPIVTLCHLGGEQEEKGKSGRNCQNYHTFGLDSHFGKRMVGNSGQTLTLPCNSRI